AIKLLDEGSTVPFIARYRKEATNGLDDIALRKLEQRLTYLRDLEDRRKVIIKSIEEQQKMTLQLKASLLDAENKTELEDIYLPYKPKRRTKGQIAIELGLEPLANALFNNPQLTPESEAIVFVTKNSDVPDTKSALDGAKYILMERFAEDAKLLQKVRLYLYKNAHIKSHVIAGNESVGSKYKDYFSHTELLKKVPSHRSLAMFRGRNEKFLHVSLDTDPEKEEADKSSYCEQIIAEHFNVKFANRPADNWLASVVQWTWRVKILLRMENELFGAVREQAEQDAINVFAKNLNDLLMAAPAGPKITMGLDPGLRTGVKIAIVDSTGKVLATSTIFPHVPQNQWDKSLRTLATLCKQHKVQLISIGNGTGSRETDKLTAEMIKANPDLAVSKIIVSEAGASVYSASELA
ncbi:MAG: Tex-like N-terminal domain-containing protein, partial [Sinobacterium sp.]